MAFLVQTGKKTEAETLHALETKRNTSNNGDEIPLIARLNFQWSPILNVALCRNAGVWHSPNHFGFRLYAVIQTTLMFNWPKQSDKKSEATEIFLR